MRIFLSYASEYETQARRVGARLRAAGHTVFIDEDDLPAGRAYDDGIREAIAASDLLVFLLAPESVAPGRYTLTELLLARQQWPDPSGRVLPVLIAPTPRDQIPAYLQSVTYLEPEGNLEAEVVMAVARLAATTAPATAPPPAPAPAGPATHQYQSLALRFKPGSPGAYGLQVGDTGPDDTASAAFTLDPAALEAALWATPSPVADQVRRGVDPSQVSVLPSGQDARRVGSTLHDALFRPPWTAQLDPVLRQVDPQRRQGVRFLVDTTSAPELARLPWELLYSPQREDFLFADPMRPVVRWLELDDPLPTLRVALPLRVLVATASPADRPALRIGDELAHLHEALASGGQGEIVTEHLPHATVERLDEALLRLQPHVLHLIGHGDFDGDQGAVLLERPAPDTGSAVVTGAQLAVLLRNHLASLRLVFLNSCLGAVTSRHDPYSGVAQSLIRRGLPAVIAMQFPIPDRVAVRLSRHFYRYLAAGWPVDAALTSARAMLLAGGEAVAWAAPALHLRAPDGRLFEVAGPAGPPTVPDAALGAPALSGAAPASDASIARPVSDERAHAHQQQPVVWVMAGLLSLVALGLGGWLVGLPGDAPVASGAEQTVSAGVPPSAEPPVAAPPDEPAMAPPPDEPAMAPPPEEHAMPPVEPEPGAPTLAAPREPPPAPVGVTAPPPPVQAEMPEPISAGSDPASSSPPTDPVAADDPLRQAAQAGLGQLDRTISELRAQLPADEGAQASAQAAAGDADPEQPGFLGGLPQLLPRSGAGAGAGARTDIGAVTSGAQVGRTPAASAPRNVSATFVHPSRTVSYRVVAGDTLWAIAGRHFGDPSRWPVLLDLNRRVLADPDRLRVGQTLALPVLAAQPGTHQVEPGDTLWGIAQARYGDGARWVDLRRANLDRVPNPDLLRVGQTLRLPASLQATRPGATTRP